MNHTMRVLAGEKRQRFFRHLKVTNALPVDQLVRVIRSKDSYSASFRVAALRNLVSAAPLEVTRGRVYCERRRLVRAHYSV